MALDNRRWRSMQELDEYTLALDEGRGQTPKASPVRLKKTDGGDDEGEIVLEPHPFFNPWVYVAMTSIANVVYIASIGGYVSASLSTIERRFQLKSSESGAITIINDVVGMIAILFVTHFGHSRHRPRIVGTAFALSGLGTIFCALPHFVYDPPSSMLQKMSGLWGANSTSSTSGGDWAFHDICNTGDFPDPSQPAEQCDSTERSTSGSLIWQIGWILFGQILCGLGTCAQPLCITYLDDNVKNKKTTSVFIGIIFSTFAVGPTLGYLLATSCLARPTFFYDSSVPPPAISQGHPYYIGAWWLGFLINGGMLIIVSVPFFFFPKSMRRKVENAVDDDTVDGSGEVKAVEMKGEDGGDVDTHAMYTAKGNHAPDQGLFAFLSGFFQTLKRIVTNVTAMSVFLAMCAELIGHIGWFIFGPKFMYTQFRLPPAKSSMLFGMMMLPGPMIGNLLASVIVRRLKLDSKGCAKMILMIYSVLVIISPVLYWLGCDNPSNAGLVVPYHTNPSGINPPFTTLPTHEEYTDDLTASCNEACNCAPDFVPVCGSDGLTYATACHAGCRDVMTADMGDVNSTLFVDCSCIPVTIDNSTVIVGVEEMSSGFAYPGECPWSCDRLYYFLGMMLTGSLIGSLVYNPSFMLQFRSHREEDRSTALGFSNVLTKLVGFIPGPVYFGALIEKTCLLFQESCGKTGNCLVYDIKAFRLVFTLFSSGGRILAFICFLIAFLSVRKRKKEEEGFIKMHPLRTARSTSKDNVETEQKYTTV